MAVSKGANTYNRQNWEDAEFPILCQTCLGDNPYIRMIREKYGDECRVCERPFTKFRWCPGARMRYKKTEICQSCAKLKNLCQTCLLDLEYGLPVQVRDSVMQVKDDIPKSAVNKEYYTQNIDHQIALQGDNSEPVGSVSKAQAPSDVLVKLARTTPYYKRNRPHICSFWVKGECRRGEECPYRHDTPSDPDDPLSEQNIRDRYYGVNDPVADKLLGRASTLPRLTAPDDSTITTLYVGGLGTDIGEKELRDDFYQFGELRSVTVVAKQQCAFITYTTRSAAEWAADMTFNKLIIKGRRLHIRWGKSQGQQQIGGSTTSPSSAGGAPVRPVAGLPLTLPPPPPLHATPIINPMANFFNLAQVVNPLGALPKLPPPPLPASSSTSLFGPPPPSLSMVPPPRIGLPPPPRMGLPSMVATSGQQHTLYPSQDPARMGSLQSGGAANK